MWFEPFFCSRCLFEREQRSAETKRAETKGRSGLRPLQNAARVIAIAACSARRPPRRSPADPDRRHDEAERCHTHRKSGPCDGTQQVIRPFLEWQKIAHDPFPRSGAMIVRTVVSIYFHDSAASLAVCITAVLRCVPFLTASELHPRWRAAPRPSVPAPKSLLLSNSRQARAAAPG